MYHMYWLSLFVVMYKYHIFNLSTVPVNRIEVFTITKGETIAGQQYRIVCTVLFPTGITSQVNVRWYGANGLISSGEGIVVGEAMMSSGNITVSLEFSPLRTSHGGQFSCRTSITSNAAPYTYTRSSEVDIIVEG